MKLYAKIIRNLLPMFVVQFFTWFALFALWIYAAPFFAQAIFHSGDAAADFESGITWAGYAFAFYVSLAAIFSFYITKISKRIGAAIPMLIFSPALDKIKPHEEASEI